MAIAPIVWSSTDTNASVRASTATCAVESHQVGEVDPEALEPARAADPDEPRPTVGLDGGFDAPTDVGAEVAHAQETELIEPGAREDRRGERMLAAGLG